MNFCLQENCLCFSSPIINQIKPIDQDLDNKSTSNIKKQQSQPKLNLNQNAVV